MNLRTAVGKKEPIIIGLPEIIKTELGGKLPVLVANDLGIAEMQKLDAQGIVPININSGLGQFLKDQAPFLSELLAADDNRQIQPTRKSGQGRQKEPQRIYIPSNSGSEDDYENEEPKMTPNSRIVEIGPVYKAPFESATHNASSISNLLPPSYPQKRGLEHVVYGSRMPRVDYLGQRMQYLHIQEHYLHGMKAANQNIHSGMAYSPRKRGRYYV